MHALNIITATVRQHGIRVTLHKILWKLRHKNINPPMLLAFKYCKGQGVELGAAAHNSFGLPRAKNVAPFSDDPQDQRYTDFALFRDAQIKICGQYSPIDIPGDAVDIPVANQSQDYVLSSHVVEHLPNLITAFQEWNRVLKPGGIVFMIFPKRDALVNDLGRTITPVEHFVQDYQTGETVATHPVPEGHGVGGHYHVFTLASMLELIAWCNQNIALGWRVEATEETDSKVGNGHTVVCRYLPEAGKAS